MMTANGLAKLIEECGELVQIAGKRLAYFSTDEHPDGAGSLQRRLEDEIADVMAACNFVAEANGLDRPRIHARAGKKLVLFHEWHAADDNNRFAVQLPSSSAAQPAQASGAGVAGAVTPDQRQALLRGLHTGKIISPSPAVSDASEREVKP